MNDFKMSKSCVIHIEHSELTTRNVVVLEAFRKLLVSTFFEIKKCNEPKRAPVLIIINSKFIIFAYMGIFSQFSPENPRK